MCFVYLVNLKRTFHILFSIRHCEGLLFNPNILQKSALRAPQELQKPLQTASEGHPDTQDSPGASPEPHLLLFTTFWPPPDRPPGTDSTAPPHSAPPAVCTFYIVLLTILFTTLRFPKSTATPDLRGRRIALEGWGWAEVAKFRKPYPTSENLNSLKPKLGFFNET